MKNRVFFKENVVRLALSVVVLAFCSVPSFAKGNFLIGKGAKVLSSDESFNRYFSQNAKVDSSSTVIILSKAKSPSIRLGKGTLISSFSESFNKALESAEVDPSAKVFLTNLEKEPSKENNSKLTYAKFHVSEKKSALISNNKEEKIVASSLLGVVNRDLGFTYYKKHFGWTWVEWLLSHQGIPSRSPVSPESKVRSLSLNQSKNKDVGNPSSIQYVDSYQILVELKSFNLVRILSSLNSVDVKREFFSRPPPFLTRA